MRIAALLLALVSCLSVNTVWGKELAPNRVAGPWTRGEKFESESTLGGYAIYKGDGSWTIDNLTASENNAYGDAQTTKFATLVLKQTEPDGYWLTSMVVKVNLTSAGATQYFSGNPCAGQHLFAESKASGTDDNCLTIDSGSYQSGASMLTYFRIKVTQSRSGGRYYSLMMDFRPDMFGLRNTTPNQWEPGTLDEDPRRAEFLKKVKRLGLQLRDGVEKAIAFDKAANAFESIPSVRSLMQYPADLADGTYPQQFVSAVQNMKGSKPFKAIAYSRYDGVKMHWNSVDEKVSQDAANSQALENCERNRKAGSDACTLYDLNREVQYVDAVAQSSAKPPEQAPAK